MGKKAMDMQSQILELLAETDAKHPGLRQLCGQMATILLALLLCRWLLNSYWMHLAHTLLTKTRCSVMKYKGPAPKTAVMRALECAIHAPNHWVNEPWRFRILGDEPGQERPLLAGPRFHGGLHGSHSSRGRAQVEHEIARRPRRVRRCNPELHAFIG